MEELLEAIDALVVEVQTMQKSGTAWFGPFSESRESDEWTDRAWKLHGTDVEWPNLVFALQALQQEVARLLET